VGIGFEIAPGLIEQRPDQPALAQRAHPGHAAHPVRARAPQKPQQQGLGLVIGVMAQ